MRLQFDQMSVQASQFGDELRVVKGEVAEVTRLISRLQSEIEAVKAQVQILHLTVFLCVYMYNNI